MKDFRHNEEEIFKTPEDYFNRSAAEIMAATVGENLDLSASTSGIRKQIQPGAKVIRINARVWIAATAAVTVGLVFFLAGREETQTTQGGLALNELNDEVLHEVILEANDELFAEYLGAQLDSISFVTEPEESVQQQNTRNEGKDVSFDHVTDEELIRYLTEEDFDHDLDF